MLLLSFVFISLGTFAQEPNQPAIPPKECDCPVQRVVEQWCWADELFLGTVTASDTIMKRTEVGKWDRDVEDHITVGFMVEHLFKGKEQPMKNVWTASDTHHCGYNFIPGQKYLVFARYDEKGNFITDRCSGTRPADIVGRQFSDSLDYLMRGGSYEIAGVEQPPCDR